MNDLSKLLEEVLNKLGMYNHVVELVLLFLLFFASVMKGISYLFLAPGELIFQGKIEKETRGIFFFVSLFGMLAGTNFLILELRKNGLENMLLFVGFLLGSCIILTVVAWVRKLKAEIKLLGFELSIMLFGICVTLVFGSLVGIEFEYAVSVGIIVALCEALVISFFFVEYENVISVLSITLQLKNWYIYSVVGENVILGNEKKKRNCTENMIVKREVIEGVSIRVEKN